jgi:hypothetical protein
MKNLIIILVAIFSFPLAMSAQKKEKATMKTNKQEEVMDIEKSVAGEMPQVEENNPESKMQHAGQEMNEEEMMKQWMESISIGEEHKEMAELEGTFSYVSTFWSQPGAEPMKSEGKTTVESLMEGRYVKETHEGEVMGMPFHGVGFTGYDKVQGEYVSTWMDNMGTGIMKFTGHKNAEGQIVTMADAINPMTHAKETHKTVTTYNPNGWVMDYFVVDSDGEEFQSMNIVYERN